MRLILLCALLCSATGAADSPIVVRLCDMLANPARYEGKKLVVAAGYRVGFEWAELTCFECGPGRIWVEFDHNVKGASKFPKSNSAFDQIFRVRFLGTFEGGGRYGHLNGYSFQFNVTEVQAAQRVWKLTPRSNEIPQDVKASLCSN